MAISTFPREFASRAAAVLGTAIEASITVRQHGIAVRAGSSCDAAARCDQAEAVLGVGPCIDAMDHLVAQIVPKIEGEPRWGVWRQRALAEGFVSAVAMPAMAGPGLSVALNLYSTAADPWDARLLTAADAYAQVTAAAFQLRLRLSDADDATVGYYRNLPEELAFERVVSAITQTNRCTEDEARAALETATREGVVSRREVAQTILRWLVVPDDGPDPVTSTFLG
jgi:hypothetical protein